MSESYGKSIQQQLEAANKVNVVPEESRVGKKLSDLTQRRVIVLVLAMLFSIPATQI